MPGKAELQVMVRNRRTKKETHTESESMAVDNPDGEPTGLIARIRYAEGVTINMGKFESARVDVALEMPSQLDREKLEKMSEFAKSWVKRALNEEVEALWEKRS